MASAVMPYLGVDAALAELQRGFVEPAGSFAEECGEVGGAGEEEFFENGSRAAADPEYPPELSRLPPGRHGLPAEFVARNQRERLVAGLAEAVAENGYAGATIAHITKAAAVSRRTFYEHFRDKDDCFVAAYETVMEELRARVAERFERSETWPRGVRDAITSILRFLAAEPNLARLSMVEAQVAGPIVVERYDAAIQSFVPYFRAGREGLSAAAMERLSQTTEEALVGGMVSLISRRVLIGQTTELETLLPDLVEFVLTPYLGAERAARVAGEE
jgi:AcrR family transcriptional regulator